MVEDEVEPPLVTASLSVVVLVVWAVIVARSVNCASEKVCVTPFDVYTVVGRA